MARDPSLGPAGCVSPRLGGRTPPDPVTPRTSTPRLDPGSVGGGSAKHLSTLDAEEIVRTKLSQREAALMRMEGENYLLSAKVQQLERKCVKSGREVHGLSCQLSQALRALGSTRGGTDGRSQRTERAYTAVATVRDGLQRLAAERPECVSPTRSYIVGSSPKAEDRRNSSFNTAMGLLKDENAKLRAELRNSSETATKLQQAMEALDVEREQRRAFEAEARAGAAALQAEGEHTTALRFEWSQAREEAERLRGQILDLQAEQHKLEGRLSDFQSREEAGSVSTMTAGGKVSQGNEEDAAKASTAFATVIDDFQPSGSSELVSKDALLWRQREMLIRLLRRDAELQLELNTLQDDVTRRDVLIHNFKQELQSVLTQQRHDHHRGSPSDPSPALTTAVADEEHDECGLITTQTEMAGLIT